MNTIVNAPKGAPKYEAEGLADLAQFIQSLADKERQLAASHFLQREKMRHTAAAGAYDHAAGILLATAIVPKAAP